MPRSTVVELRTRYSRYKGAREVAQAVGDAGMRCCCSLCSCCCVVAFAVPSLMFDAVANVLSSSMAWHRPFISSGVETRQRDEGVGSTRPEGLQASEVPALFGELLLVVVGLDSSFGRRAREKHERESYMRRNTLSFAPNSRPKAACARIRL